MIPKGDPLIGEGVESLRGASSFDFVFFYLLVIRLFYMVSSLGLIRAVIPILFRASEASE